MKFSSSSLSLLLQLPLAGACLILFLFPPLPFQLLSSLFFNHSFFVCPTFQQFGTIILHSFSFLITGPIYLFSVVSVPQPQKPVFPSSVCFALGCGFYANNTIPESDPDPSLSQFTLVRGPKQHSIQRIPLVHVVLNPETGLLS